MPLTIHDVRVLDTSAFADGSGGMMRTSTSMHERLITSLPAELSWDVSFVWSRPDKSTVTCTAEVRDASDRVVATSESPVWRLAAAATDGDVTLSLPTFRVTVTGTYEVLLFVDGAVAWRGSFLVTDSLPE